MKVSWWEFHSLFPNYYDFKTPMWSSCKSTDGGFELEVVVPGYEKEDFVLTEEDGELKLSINREKDDPLIYSILGRYRSSNYDLSRAEAEYKAGILKITVPKVQKKQKALARRIGIN